MRTTARCHLILDCMAMTKNTKDNEAAEKGNTFTLLVGIQTDAATTENRKAFGIAWSHLSADSKSNSEVENRMVVASGWRVGEMRRCWAKGTNFRLCRLSKFGSSNV